MWSIMVYLNLLLSVLALYAQVTKCLACKLVSAELGIETLKMSLKRNIILTAAKLFCERSDRAGLPQIAMKI